MLNKVMVVDDSPLVREMCSSLLKGKAREVVHAASGCEAISLLERHLDTDVMLLDLHLPNMNGLSVLAAVKESKQHRNVPVILLSLKGDEAVEARGFELGAIGSVRKFENLRALPRLIGHMGAISRQKDLCEADA